MSAPSYRLASSRMVLRVVGAALLFAGSFPLYWVHRSPSERNLLGPSWAQAARGGPRRPRIFQSNHSDAKGCGRAPLMEMLTGSRIVGGTEVPEGKWPWIVSLQITYGRLSAHTCGGSLVKDRWVITAAHCTKDERDPLKWRAVIGTNNIYRLKPHGKMMKVEAISIHPDFILETYVNDIALFHLKKAVKYNDYIRPICLPFNVFQKLDEETKCFISGWGRTQEEGNSTNMLQEAAVHYISRQICNSALSYGGIIPNSSFCAGDENGNFDTCRGDSGGPLMCYLPEYKRFFMMGITSYGNGCGRKNFPGIYSGPSFFQEWLTEHFSQKKVKGGANTNLSLGQTLVALACVISLVTS